MNKPRPLDELLAAAEHAQELKEEQERTKIQMGQALRAFRQEHNLSQTFFAAQLGKSQEYVSQIESGSRSATPSTINQLINVAQILSKEEPHDGKNSNKKE